MLQYGDTVATKRSAAPAMHSSLSVPHPKIYPREASGRYTRARWACVWITQLVYYGSPWLTWNGRPAVLFDLSARKFYLFGIVLWPHDLIYLAGLLMLSAGFLFALSALAGRVWCGHACPHSVYSEIFMWLERWIEGDRSARIRLDRQPASFSKSARKAVKHGAWGLVALWTGVTLVAYFTPMRTLLQGLGALSLGIWQTFWIFAYGGLAYINAGWMREQFCKHICAYSRFQSVMFDRDTLLIAYDRERGEPRGVRRSWRTGSEPVLGDCIDCTLCMQVCPTGIDIRAGLQFECIDCGACIDACDSVMDKIGAARGLIRYSSENATWLGLSQQQMRRRMLRPRILVYFGVLFAGTALYISAIATRVPLKLSVIADRVSLGYKTDDGAVEQIYRLQLTNAEERAHRYSIAVSGIHGIAIAMDAELELDALTMRSFPVRVRVPGDSGRAGANAICFEAVARDASGVRVLESATFFIPPRD